ncbi:MAG: ParB/RepB/Spo0J family partition protein [Isosphaeraceae bacterium]
MGKMDDLRRRAAGNVAESMGAGVENAPMTFATRAVPAHLQGVVRSKDVAQIQVDRIAADPAQPREEFDEESLERLAESLKTRGQLQPIRVRWDEGQGLYTIVCGERRWRAAKLAGLASVSCVIVEGVLDPSELLAIQLVENALREDLRPIEQARAYRQLMDRNGWSTRQLARELSVAQPQVVRALSLLNLPEPVQEQVEQGALAPATAYEIGKLHDAAEQTEMAEQVVKEKLTRQDAVEAVRRRREEGPKVRHATPGATRPAPLEIRVSDAVVVTVKYRKADRMSPVQALRAALKQALAMEKAGDASIDAGQEQAA